MSSRVFQANTSDSPSNPQRCGLTSVPIKEGDWCFYLVCNGRSARPEWQISVVAEEEYTYRGKKQTRSIRETPDGKRFFSVFTGQWESYTKPDGTKGRRRVYEWQTEDPKTGARIPVTVWSNMVLADAAEKLGYKVPKNAKGDYVKTKAHKGDRTQGFEHQHGEEEPAMLTIAKAALDDESAGLVPPKDDQPPAALVPAAVVTATLDVDEEAELAAALGMSVEQFRKLNEEG
jgi:hypothetical protein